MSKADQLNRTVATEFLIWNQNRTNGEALAFLRKELGNTRDELAGRLDVTPQEIYSWEEARKKPIPLEADRALRALFN